jgi:DNA-binding IclR family transcriptional regulator
MSASPSPPTRRALDVVEFLARHHDEAIRLSDVVRQVGINQATAHSILSELCARGWASRDPADKTFSLGPVVATLAVSIDESRPRTHAARAAALKLADDTNFGVSVSERAGDGLMITFTASPGGIWTGSAGERIPFAAPFGPAFAAWDSAEERSAWSRRSGVTDPVLATRLDEYLALTRERGFSIERITESLAQAMQMMTNLHADALSDSLRSQISQVLGEMTAAAGVSSVAHDRGATEPVSAMAAPVTDSRGRVVLNICVHPFRPLTSRQAHQVGRRLVAAAATVNPSAG